MRRGAQRSEAGDVCWWSRKGWLGLGHRAHGEVALAIQASSEWGLGWDDNGSRD